MKDLDITRTSVIDPGDMYRYIVSTAEEDLTLRYEEEPDSDGATKFRKVISFGSFDEMEAVAKEMLRMVAARG